MECGRELLVIRRPVEILDERCVLRALRFVFTPHFEIPLVLYDTSKETTFTALLESTDSLGENSLEALGAALRIVGPDDARQGPISVGHQGATDGQGPLNLSLLHSR